jgi:isopenicillin-N epimerase
MNVRDQWRLNPEVDFLNHGSFGATPIAVLETQRRFQDALERDPVQFLAPERDLEAQLDGVRDALSRLAGVPARDLAFVRNATDGVNAVLRSMPLVEGDEIIITDHGYNACNNAARYAAGRSGAITRVAKVPFPISSPDQVLQAIEAEMTDRTRLVLVDHVTSPTGLVFPVEEIVRAAHGRGVRVMVDGAHAPGMLPLDLCRIDADYYTANHHKWLCAPKTSGFLYVHPRWQDEVRPTIISHAANRPRPGRSRFLAEFDWNGTFDPTPLLTVPAAIEFLDALCDGGLEALMQTNRRRAIDARAILCRALDIDSHSPQSMLGSLAAVPLPIPHRRTDFDGQALQRKLYEHQRIEVPVFPWPHEGTWVLRVSMQAYNELDQVHRLGDVLRRELGTA